MNPSLKPLLCSALAALSFAATTPVFAADSSAGSGDIAIYTNDATAGPAIAAGASFTHDFATNVRQDPGSFSRSGANITLNRTGHYLAIYNSQFDSTGNPSGGGDRSEFQTGLYLNGSPLASGWSQGYIRRASNADECITAGAAIFEATATDVLTLQTDRTDNSNGTAQRAASETALQLIKLDDVNMSYARLWLNSTIAGPTSTAFQTVAYDMDDLDAGFTHGTAGELTLVDGGYYLVTANTYANNVTARNTMTQRLTLAGTEITGSKTVTYLRGADSCNEGAVSVAMIIKANASDILRVQTAMGDGVESPNLVGGRCALSVVKLPDLAGTPTAVAPDYIRLERTSNFDVNLATDTAITWPTQVETPSAAFAHSTVAPDSAIIVNTAGDYLFFGTVYDSDDEVTRAIYHQGWSVNGGARAQYGQTGRYTRNAGPPRDAQGIGHVYGNFSGFIGDSLAATNTVEMVSMALGAANGTAPAILQAEEFSLQGVRLASLFTFDLYAVDSTKDTVVVGEDGTTDTYDLNLRTSPAAGNVTVTVTADAETEVSTDGIAWSGSGGNVVLVFSDTTPQTVHVRGFDDADIEGPHGGAISHAITASDDLTNYPLSLVIPNVTASITDNDVVAVAAVNDTVTGTDEDTIATEADLTNAPATLLTNDTDGLNNFVSAFDATSVYGATVAVNADGTFTYDPSTSSSLQALGTGQSLQDAFTYTVEDAEGNTSVGTVNLTIDGVNATPVAGADSLAVTDRTTGSVNLLANDSDEESGVTLTIFDGVTIDPLLEPYTITSSTLGGTVTVSSNGDITYDPCSAAAILALADGASGTPEVISYTVEDAGGDTGVGTLTVSSLGVPGGSDDFTTTDASTPLTGLTLLTNDTINSGAAGTATTGAAVELVASGAGNTDTTWNNTGSGGGTVTMQSPGTGSVLTTGLTEPPGVTAAYTLSGTNSGASILAPAASGTIWGSDISGDSVTLELVFKPADLTGNHTLLDLGGATTGSSLFLLGDQLVANWGEGGNVAAQAFTTLPAANAGSEYVHAVVVFDDPADETRLYVNGVLVSTGSSINYNTGNPAAIGDWSGGDASGIGQFNGSLGGDVFPLGNFGSIDIPALSDFDGEIAIFRAYASILNQTQITANADAVFNAFAGPPAGTDVTTFDGTSANGGIVTYNSGTSEFSYDPNGQFASLPSGQQVTDSFTYTLDSDVGSVVTVKVGVTGTNTSPAISIAADQPGGVLEGTNPTFTLTASSVPAGGNATVSYSGTAVNGQDFNGATTVPLNTGGLTTPLTLTDTADNLFEGGVETLFVTLDSVDGGNILGSPLVAGTTITDGDSAPVVSIAADSPTASEGTYAGFTVSTPTGVESDITVNLSYSGTTTSNVDFFGVSSVTIPASGGGGLNLDASFEVFLVDDGIADAAETLTVTIDSVSTGTIGTASDTVTISDGAASPVTVFDADFEGATVTPPNPDSSTTAGNALTAANAGTAVGTWEGIFAATGSGGEVPGVYEESNDAAGRGDGIDNCLVLDRPLEGDGQVAAKFSSSIDIGSNTAVICFDLAVRRTTQTAGQDKEIVFVGRDSAGNKSFEFLVDTLDISPTDGQIVPFDSVGAPQTPVGVLNEFANEGQDEQETDYHAVKLVLGPGGYRVAIDRELDGVYELFSGTLAYAGPATQIGELFINAGDNADGNLSSGFMLDEITASGVIANEAPSLTLDGSTLADAGSTAVADMVLANTKTFSSVDNTELQVDDPETTSIDVRLQATLGDITVTLAGSATAPANGSADVTINGTVADVNATLANGVVYDPGLVGGAETITITVDDNGQAGAGGVQTISHDLTFFIFEDPTVTIDQAAGQDDPGLTSPVDFTVVFSEDVENFGDPGDVVVSGTAGATTAVVTGGPATYNVAVSGMTSTGTVIATIPADAAQRIGTSDGNEPSTSSDNVVTFVLNTPPTATNLTQLVPSALVGDGDMVELDDIVVTDGNNVLTSVIAAPATELFNYDGGTNVTTFPGGGAGPFGPTFTLPDPVDNDGFSLDIAFTPTAADVAVGGAGTQNGVTVFETGGNSNGAGLVLIEGDLVFIVKMNGAGADEPTVPLPDTDWGGNTIALELLDAVPADEEVTAAIIFDLDSVRYSVNGGQEVVVPLTNRAGRNNWGGDNSLNIGKTSSNVGGIGQGSPTYWDEAFFDADLTNNVTSVRFWNASTSDYAIGDFEELTATLSIAGYTDDATSGILSSSAGSYSAGSWTITGMRAAVNAALADVKYTFGTGGAPVEINVTIDDGDEDGSGPLSGVIFITEGGANAGPLYVDDGSFGGATFGQAVTDADFGAVGDQGATFGIDAFASLGDAIAAADPALGVTIIVNDGDYSGESVDLLNDLPLATLRLAQTVGGVSVNDIVTASTNTLDLQGNTLAANSGTITSPITSSNVGSGGLTKNGSGLLVLQNTTSHTGTTAVNNGTLRIGTDGASLLADLGGNGPVTVTAPGLLEFNPALPTQTITQVGQISGTGSVGAIGDGTVIFNTGGNSFSGDFILGDGGLCSFDADDDPVLDATKRQGFVVVNHNDDLGSGEVQGWGSQLQAGVPGIVIPNSFELNNSSLRLGGANDFEISGVVRPNASPRTIGHYGLDGLTVTLSGGTDFTDGGFNIQGTDGADNGSLVLTDVGSLAAGGNIDVIDNFDGGEVTLGGTNSYTGTTTVQSGTLILDGTHTGGGAYTVQSGATLAGGGSTASAVTVDAGGTLSPGGTGIADLATGALNVAGALVIDVDNTAGAAGTAYDQVVVTGTVDVGGSLTVNDGAGPEANPADITIIANDDVDAVGATFSSGVPFSSDYLGSGRVGYVAYDGGDGNDVVLIDYSQIEAWRLDNGFALNGDDDGLDLDLDNLANLLEFGFGTDVGVSDNALLNPDGSVNGTPTIQASGGGGGVTFDALFNRRDDFGQSGSVSYTVEFSGDLITFFPSGAPVTILTDSTDDPDYHVARVAYPALLPNGQKARFFRVVVTVVP